MGIKEGYYCFLFQIPKNYFDLLEAIPKNSQFDDGLTQSSYDFEHVFVTQMNELEEHWSKWKSALKKDGTLWISWPKGSSKLETNLNGNLVREFGLKGGLVDVKVCAVDEYWSGLKFMYRKKDR